MDRLPLVKEGTEGADDESAIHDTDVELTVAYESSLNKGTESTTKQVPVLVRAVGYHGHSIKPTSLRGLARLLASMTDIPATDVEPQQLVGKGSYSVVYKSWLKEQATGSRRTVAIKRPRAKTANNLDNMTFFCEEGVLMKTLDHR